MPAMHLHFNSCQLDDMANSSNIVLMQNLYRANESEDIAAFYGNLLLNMVWKERDGFLRQGHFRSREKVFIVLKHE
jgi:hypothetical protein